MVLRREDRHRFLLPEVSELQTGVRVYGVPHGIFEIYSEGHPQDRGKKVTGGNVSVPKGSRPGEERACQSFSSHLLKLFENMRLITHRGHDVQNVIPSGFSKTGLLIDDARDGCLADSGHLCNIGHVNMFLHVFSLVIFSPSFYILREKMKKTREYPHEMKKKKMFFELLCIIYT